MASVSIIVPVYNVEEYLDECLESIRRQTLKNLEIICVNDGSNDRSRDILERHVNSDGRIRLINEENRGYGHAINVGIKAATSPYIGIVESDDYIDPMMYEVLINCAEKHSLDVVRANYWFFWSKPTSKNELFEAYDRSKCNFVFNPRDMEECFFFPPALWSMLVRRQIIVDNGLTLLETPGAAFQDTAFSFKVWACAHRAMLISDAYLHYRQDNENSSINQKGKAYYVCDEYREIDCFVHSNVEHNSLTSIAAKRRYDAYIWNMGRIASDLQHEFAFRASSEFRELQKSGELHREYFSRGQWKELKLLIEHPKLYVQTVLRSTNYQRIGIADRIRAMFGLS